MEFIGKIPYFCNRIEATLSVHKSGSHVIAWTAITISVLKVSYDLQLRRGSIAVPRSCILITAYKWTDRH